MKRTFFILTCILFTSTFATGQIADSLKSKINPEGISDLCAIYTPLLSNNFYGFNIDIIGYRTKKWGTGIYFTYFRKKISDTFSYSIGRPIVDFYEVGFINQYDFLKTYRIRIDVNLINGLAVSRLGDNAIKVSHWWWWKFPFQYYTSRKIATNYYYLFEPGLDISLHLFSDKQGTNFYLTTKAKYRFLFGDCKYGTMNQFSNYLMAVGVSITGF
jgi:hypothetical protein